MTAAAAGAIFAGVGAAAAVAGGVMQYNANQDQARTASAMAAYNAHQQELNAKMQLMSMQAQSAAQKRLAEANFRMRGAEAQARFNNAASIENTVVGRRSSTRESIRRNRMEQDQQAASMRTNIAARGIVESVGTPADIIAEQVKLQNLENADSLYSSELDNLSLFREAEMERFGGKMALAGASLDRSSELAGAGLRAAAGQAEFRASQRQADLTRLSGAASAQGYRGQAVGNLFSGVAQGATGLASVNWKAFT